MSNPTPSWQETWKPGDGFTALDEDGDVCAHATPAALLAWLKEQEEDEDDEPQ